MVIYFCIDSRVKFLFKLIRWSRSGFTTWLELSNQKDLMSNTPSRGNFASGSIISPNVSRFPIIFFTKRCTNTYKKNKLITKKKCVIVKL